MKNFLVQFGLRFTTGHALWAAALIPACIALFLHLDRAWTNEHGGKLFNHISAPPARV